MPSETIFSISLLGLSAAAAWRCALTACAAGPSHASQGFRSENAQRWKRSEWNCRDSFAVTSLLIDWTNGCAKSS